MNLRVVAVWLLLCLIWGSTWLFIKVGLEDLPPVTFVGLRFLLAALLLWLLVAARRSPLPRHRGEWVLLLSSGLLSALNYCLLFWGEQHTSSGLAAVIQALIPAYGLLIAHFYLPSERITPAKITGVLTGIAGVGLIFSDQLGLAGMLAFQGSLAIAIGSFAAAYSNVLVKAFGRGLDPTIVAAGQITFGMVPMLALGYLWEGSPLHLNWTRNALISLFYLATAGSALAFVLYYWLVRQVEVTKTMLIALVTPVVAVSLGRVVLNERLTWRIVVGGLAILAGIGLTMAQSFNRRITEEAA